jgi:HAD superfamily hydrolase (TIGR01459 family)
MVARISGLDELAGRFDAFLVDQFGVLLDGTAAYPGAAAALARLAALGKPVILLSNSGKRAEANAARLVRFGFDRASFRMVMSSGEVASRLLEAGALPGIPAGARTLLLAREDGEAAVEGLPLSLVAEADEAELVLLAGSRGDTLALEDYAAMLAPAAARGVPMLCTNPDMTMLTPAGPRFGAGRIAALYGGLGGQVRYVGKPHRLIYDAALAALGYPDPARVVAIGDSPAHDVAGGRDAGLATALVRTGIHAGLDEGALHDLCIAEGMVPDYVLPRFAFADGG